MKNRGFTLLEVATALFIIGVMTAMLIPLATSMVDANRATQTYNEEAAIYAAIMGNPANGTFGYMGDVGSVPNSLMDLVQEPATNPSGWNGPYISNVRVENNLLLDPFGSPYECYYLRDTSNGSTIPDQLVIISRGPDKSSTNFADASPNSCSNATGTFTGTVPSSASYATATYLGAPVNLDNILFPRVTDSAGLINMNQVGTLSINIFNYDNNASALGGAPNGALVPGCPALYSITATSLARITSAGVAQDTFSMPSGFGANTVDLPEGLYDVQVTNQSQTSPGVLWEQKVAIAPGATSAYNLNLSAIDSSSQTPTENLRITNTSGGAVFVLKPAATSGAEQIGTVASAMSGTFTTNPCAPITIRSTSYTGAIIDAFTLPAVDVTVFPGTMTSTTYTRLVNANVLTPLVVTNKDGGYTTGNASKDQAFVFSEGVLIGVVGARGAKKTKTFLKVKVGSTIDIFDRSGTEYTGWPQNMSVGLVANLP